MSGTLDRRSFLCAIPALAGALHMNLPTLARAQAGAPPASYADEVPRHELKLVQSFVGSCHSNLAEATRLIELKPALARASWDWGFGDWETGLGAAAHTGQREIAELNLANGAHPTLFSAAMLGQLDVVKAIIAARPGVQGTLGPHAITLLAHARAGGKDSEPVVKYLESVGGADARPATAPLENADRDALVGRYAFGAGERDHFEVDVKNDQLGMVRPGTSRRMLMHTGGLVFFPSGVPSVRIAFARAGTRVSRLTIADREVYLTAERKD